MLTDSLRGLEPDGFVDRSVYAEVPVRVEYSLTTLGWAATELLMTLAEWADEHLADVEQARLSYRQTAANTRSVKPTSAGSRRLEPQPSIRQPHGLVARRDGGYLNDRRWLSPTRGRSYALPVSRGTFALRCGGCGVTLQRLHEGRDLVQSTSAADQEVLRRIR